MENIYLDHAATSPMHPEVVATMTEILTETFGNPSSVHLFGRQAAGKLEMAREVIGKSLGVQNIMKLSLIVAGQKVTIPRFWKQPFLASRKAVT